MSILLIVVHLAIVAIERNQFVQPCNVPWVMYGANNVNTEQTYSENYGKDKMAILQMRILNSFSLKLLYFDSKFSKVYCYWSRKCIGTKQVTSHYLNQWWHSLPYSAMMNWCKKCFTWKWKQIVFNVFIKYFEHWNLLASGHKGRGSKVNILSVTIFLDCNYEMTSSSPNCYPSTTIAIDTYKQTDPKLMSTWCLLMV